MMIGNVGIVGAGQMGSGIAHVVSLSGRKVQLLDLDQDLLRRSIETIEKNMARQASRGKITEEDVKSALSRIETATDYSGFKNCDIVIEAATENEDIKRKIFQMYGVTFLEPSQLNSQKRKIRNSKERHYTKKEN